MLRTPQERTSTREERERGRDRGMEERSNQEAIVSEA
jgi:hypothetical protein